MFKLLGNSGYRKLIEALERLTCVVYAKDEKVVDRAMRSGFFEDLDEPTSFPMSSLYFETLGTRL